MDPNSLANSILTALGGHQYLLAASLALVAAVAGVRWLAPKLHDKTGAWLNSDRGGAVLSILLSIFGGLATALKAGQPISFALISKMILVAATGSGLFNLTKRISKPSDKKVPNAPSAPVAPPAAAFLPLILIPALLLNGCGMPALKDCSTPTPAIQKKCDLEHGLISCGITDANQIFQLAAEAIAAIATNSFDEGAFVSQLEGDGIPDASCVISKLIAYVAGNSAEPRMQKAFAVSVERKMARAKAKAGGK